MALKILSPVKKLSLTMFFLTRLVIIVTYKINNYQSMHILKLTMYIIINFSCMFVR